MTLESIILELTAQTPSGGTCRIGNTSFKIWYCSDIWEWEYQGVTYFDPLDLAEALVQGTRSPALRTPSLVGPAHTPASMPLAPMSQTALNRRPRLDAGA